jgi:hypothetical protein
MEQVGYIVTWIPEPAAEFDLVSFHHTYQFGFFKSTMVNPLNPVALLLNIEFLLAYTGEEIDFYIPVT